MNDEQEQAILQLLKSYEHSLKTKIDDLTTNTTNIKSELHHMSKAWDYEIETLRQTVLGEVKEILTIEYQIDNIPKIYEPQFQQVRIKIDQLEEQITDLEEFCEVLANQGWFF